MNEAYESKQSFNIENKEIKYMATEYAKECINAEDGRLIAKALDELTKKQTKEGAYDEDIRSTEIAKDAINRVLDHASFEHDEICFYVNVGTKKRNIFGF